MSSDDILQVKCDTCGENAQEPYIECCDCEANLCTSCFAAGQEVRNHKSDHKYAVRKNNFPLFDHCNWSAKEEKKLLSALSTCGYGNWEEISKIVQTRSKLECQEHYRKYYIDNVQFAELKILPETQQSLFPKLITPYLYNTDLSLDPPRNNLSDQHFAGYNAYRSEFELSYDHNAESIFNIENEYSEDDDEEEEEMMVALKVAMVKTLNTRLKERRRRYNIIKEHGLITPQKILSKINFYVKTLTCQTAEKLLGFMQFMKGMQFDAFIESLSLEMELQQKLLRLYEYRQLGIRTLYGVRVYKAMKDKHNTCLIKQKNYTLDMARKFDLQFSCNKFSRGKDSSVKKLYKSALPLEIIDLPGYNLLNEAEKKLCSTLRLVPQNYIDMKALMILEHNKLGHLKLQDARKLLKIDVNKTRKIYDLLINEGFLTNKTH